MVQAVGAADREAEVPMPGFLPFPELSGEFLAAELTAPFIQRHQQGTLGQRAEQAFAFARLAFRGGQGAFFLHLADRDGPGKPLPIIFDQIPFGAAPQASDGRDRNIQGGVPWRHQRLSGGGAELTVVLLREITPQLFKLVEIADFRAKQMD